MDGSPGISVRTLVAKQSEDDDVEWKRGRSGEQLWMRKMDDCRLAVPCDRGDGRKFAENPRDSKSDDQRIRAEEGSVRVSFSRRVDPRYSLPSIISFHELSS